MLATRITTLLLVLMMGGLSAAAYCAEPVKMRRLNAVAIDDYTGQVSRLKGDPPTEPDQKDFDMVVRTPKPRADGLPVGEWKVTFSDKVTGMWTIKQDEAHSIIKDKRHFAKKPTVQNGAVVIRFDDDHVERWTPVGQQMVVEHWSSADKFPSERALLGIAEQRLPVYIKDGIVVGDVIPDQLVTSVKKPIAAKGPTFVFEVYRLEYYSNFHYRIDVCNENGTLVLQSVEFRSEVRLEDEPDAIKIADMDGDAYLDIRILGGQRKGSAWYKVWRYDSAKGQFLMSQDDSGERSSDLKRTLGCELTVIDKHEAWRAEGLDKAFAIQGPANEYMVRLQAPPGQSHLLRAA